MGYSGSGTGTPVSGSTLRVTPTEVRQIFETDLADVEITAGITLANQMITALDLAGTGSLSTATLKQIELLLSAHFCSLKDPRVQRERVGQDFQATYQGKTDMGLNATFYGQQAIVLDYSGTLATYASGLKRAMFKTVFSAYDEIGTSTG